MKELLTMPEFWLDVLLLSFFCFVIYLTIIWAEEQTEQATDWCFEQGEYLVTERDMPQVCIDRDVIILPTGTYE